MNLQSIKAGMLSQESKELRTTLCLALAALTAAVYCQVAHHDFINYDDQMFVYQNSHVNTGVTLDNLKWAFTALNGNTSYWHPLTWISLQLDCQLFGLQPGGLHLTNVWLHIANTILVFLLLKTMTGAVWRSGVVAALFALHPLHIETVAWISERKTLLCTFFWLLATIAYVRYAKKRSVMNYLVVFLLFAASLMSKPLSVTLPFTLLLLDFWPLNRLGPQTAAQCHGQEFCSAARICPELRDVRMLIFEKVPFFLLAGAGSCMAIVAQDDLGALSTLKTLPLLSRIDNAIVSYCLYLRKMVWPSDLSPIYPLRMDWLWWHVGACALFIFCITFVTIRSAIKHPYLFMGWFWYLGTLVPVSGLVQAGSQGMADRYTYVSLLGIFIALVWATGEIAQWMPKLKAISILGTTTLIAAFAVSTAIQVGYWKNCILLFEHAARATEDNARAYQNLGLAFESRDNLAESEASLRTALKLFPTLASAHRTLGAVLFMKGDLKDAFDEYETAVKLKPDDPETHADLADFYTNAGNPKFLNPALSALEARRACSLTRYRQRKYLILLADALALNKEYREASEAATKAVVLSVSIAERDEASNLAKKIRKYLPNGAGT